jgi:uncharacterized membrane protein required for colicin V production
MGIDLAICIIVFVSAVCYAHIGFVRSVVSALSWVAGLACGLFFYDEIRSFIYGCGVGRKIEASIAGSLSDSIMESSAVQSAPEIIRKWVGIAADTATTQVSEGVASLIITLLSFFILMLAVKIVLFVIVHLLSKEYHDGPLAFIDSTGGLILGVALGVFYVLLLLAGLVLVMEFLPDDTAVAIRTYLNESYFSGIIYDNNPLFILFRYAKAAILK